jgi:hypothetical protein
MFRGPDLAPVELRDEIDAWNARIYRDVNNGVYRAGFARTQEAYDAAVREVFAALDEIEAHLAGRDWLCGDRYTEADLRLFPTLARFDVAYHYAFKCNIRRLTDYPRLWDYARASTIGPVWRRPWFEIYKQGYFSPSELRNPLGIVPAGPEIDWTLRDADTYILRRVFQSVLVLLVVGLVAFAMFRFVGDPIDTCWGRNARWPISSGCARAWPRQAVLRAVLGFPRTGGAGRFRDLLPAGPARGRDHRRTPARDAGTGGRVGAFALASASSSASSPRSGGTGSRPTRS